MARLDDIHIRTELRPGDLGYVVFLHGKIYGEEYQYGIGFETYVAEGLVEFYRQYNPERNRVWICEDHGRFVGFMLLMDRGEAAQLRYFILDPGYRGLGLGRRLMALYMEFLQSAGYRSSFLWTTHELPAAAHLYKMAGFQLTVEKESTAFGKKLREQRYDIHL